MSTIKEDILNTAMEEFRVHGMKFTIQDIASSMHIAKKTIYQYFPSKEELLISLVDYGFEQIHADKKAIAEADLPIVEKIRRIMIAMPEQYQMMDFRLLANLQEKMPAVYAVLMHHLETNWEPVIQLLQQGIDEGKIRSDVDLRVLQMMVTSTFELFLSTDLLMQNKIGYQEALNAMMDIVMKGITEEGV